MKMKMREENILFIIALMLILRSDFLLRMEAARHAASRLQLLRRGGGGAPSHRSRSSCACRQVTYSGQPVKQPKKIPVCQKIFNHSLFFLQHFQLIF
jgi:hypothetical protein